MKLLLLQAWQDLKGKIKKKQATIKRHQVGTGGGPPLPTTSSLSNEEEIVVGMLGVAAIEGHEGIEESDISFADGSGDVEFEQVIKEHDYVLMEDFQEQNKENDTNNINNNYENINITQPNVIEKEKNKKKEALGFNAQTKQYWRIKHYANRTK